MISRLKCRLKNKLRDKLNCVDFIQNLNLDLSAKQKSILISYIDFPLKQDITSNIHHSNGKELIQMIKILINLNYKIDVVRFNEESYEMLLKDKKYDVIFGFGEPFYYSCLNNPNSKKILYLTENNPNTVKEKFNERVLYYKNRKGKVRTGILRNNIYNIKYFEIADYGILLNNMHNAKASIPLFEKYFLLNPTGLLNPDFVFKPKIHTESRQNFLWFGSSGAIHKGLDLLIDVFYEKQDFNLHICGISEKEYSIFNNIMPNIIYHGRIDVNTNDFIKLVESCSYVILPSCSEGVSTSVSTCMLHGMIPVVTKDAGIDINEFGFDIKSIDVEYICSLIDELSCVNSDKLEILRRKSYDYAQDNFRIEKFTLDFEKAIKLLI